jgi:hypothetical protein
LSRDRGEEVEVEGNGIQLWEPSPDGDIRGRGWNTVVGAVSRRRHQGWRRECIRASVGRLSAVAHAGVNQAKAGASVGRGQ